MSRLRYAKLAVCAALMMLLAAGTLEEPLKVRFQLTDGVRITGEMTGWDAEGFDGTFGRRKWIEVKGDDAWKLYQRVMDQQSWPEWVDLGRAMLLNPQADKKSREQAERAFGRALQLNEAAKDAIQSARDEAIVAEQKRRDAERAAKAAKLKTISPEGETWPANSWPVLTDEEQHAAVLAMKAEAQRIVEKSNAPMTLIETDHFLLHSDAPREQMAQWSILLEKELNVMVRMLQASDGQAAVRPKLWGKIAVIVFMDQDRFRLVEAENFNQLVPLATVGICHAVGPRAFVMLRQASTPAEFQWTLMREAALAIMHRYRSPARPPAWANEGFAEFVAAMMQPESAFGNARRKQALQFIREGGDVGGMFDLKYTDQSWAGKGDMNAAIGGLLIELLFREQPERYFKWLNAVKDGKPWEESLKRELGVTRESLLETFVRYYKVND